VDIGRHRSNAIANPSSDVTQHSRVSGVGLTRWETDLGGPAESDRRGRGLERTNVGGLEVNEGAA